LRKYTTNPGNFLLKSCPPGENVIRKARVKGSRTLEQVRKTRLRDQEPKIDRIESITVERVAWSLGTSNRSWEEFISLLRTYAVDMVVDVRSFPASKFPHFKKNSLLQSLGEEGFGYYYLGKELGGYRKGGYEAYTQTLEYLVGVELLERMASRCRSAILCAERLPWRCHRRFIGRSLQERGWKVIHILDEKRIWEDKVPGGKDTGP
jgi:hypothetical protein